MRDVKEILAECITRLGRRARCYTVHDVRAVMIIAHPPVPGTTSQRVSQWRCVQLVMKDDTQSAPAGVDIAEAHTMRAWAIERGLPFSG